MEENQIVAANKTEEIATTQKVEEPMTQTQAFARRLKEMTEKAVMEKTSEINEKLFSLENDRQDQEFMSSEIKDVYKTIRADVRDYSSKNKTDIKTAYKEILADKLPDIIKQTKERTNEEAQKAFRENAMASPGRLGGNNVEEKVDYANLSNEELDEMIVRALNGELK